MQTFFSDDDYREYIALMADSCRRYEVDVWAYCLMPNHIHFIAVPSQPDTGVNRLLDICCYSYHNGHVGIR